MRTIVLVSHYYPAHRGGIEAVANTIARGLSGTHGYSVAWFASGIDAAPVEGAPANLRFSPMATWNVVEKKIGLPWPLWAISDLRRLWDAVRTASLVHVHDFIYQGSLVAIIAAMVHRKPILLTQHIGFIPYKSKLLSGILSAINRTLGSWSMRRATQVVFVSEAVKEYFSSFITWERRPASIANGIDCEVFKPALAKRRAELRAQVGIEEGPRVFIFVGRFTEKKGLPVVKWLVGALQNVQWIVVGHGAERPEEWGFQNLRVFRGLSSRDLVPLYQIADLLVLPSRGEGFPLVVQEAMACGTPAIVSAETAGGAPAALEVLLQEPVEGAGDYERWRVRLLSLLEDPRELAGMREPAAGFARREWGVDDCIARYDQIIDEIAGRD